MKKAGFVLVGPHTVTLGLWRPEAKRKASEAAAGKGVHPYVIHHSLQVPWGLKRSHSGVQYYVP